MQDVFEDYNLRRKCNVIVFHDIIAAMTSNKKPILIVAELLIRGNKLNISTAFITQSDFVVWKDVRMYIFLF